MTRAQQQAWVEKGWAQRVDENTVEVVGMSQATGELVRLTFRMRPDLPRIPVVPPRP